MAFFREGRIMIYKRRKPMRSSSILSWNFRLFSGLGQISSRDRKSGIFLSRGRSRPAATSKMERFVVIVNDWKPLAIIIKRSILDVGAALDPRLVGGTVGTQNPQPPPAEIGLTFST